MRRAGISVLIVVGLVALAGGVASAGVSQFPTVFDKFKYKNDGNSKPEFSGKIASPEDKCVKGRDVKLFRKKNGDSKKIGKDSSDGKGKFKIKLDDDPPKSGKYYAEVEQKKFGQSGDKTTCKPTKSGKVEIS
jgi:hypothetical protein